MRLTERKVCFPRCDKQGNLTKVDYIKIKDKKLAEEKLCQLEDIEDELGIDLITFTKIVISPILYIKIDNSIKKVFMQTISSNDNKDDRYLIWFEDLMENRYMFSLKNYGKTWALTREELL